MQNFQVGDEYTWIDTTGCEHKKWTGTIEKIEETPNGPRFTVDYEVATAIINPQENPFIWNEEICTDCMLYMANGDLPEDCTKEREQQIVNGAIRSQEQLKFPSIGEYLGFSTGGCWACESHLGGDRYELNYCD